jgi:predicted Rossmann fold flavoprotein
LKVIIVGGGAAGIFTAINIAERHPNWEVTVLEKSSKLLSKVKVSGGGRCNVTNVRDQPGELVTFYPRGGKKLYKVFKSFLTTDMRSWLADRGVPTIAEPDNRVFPQSNDSQTIIDCFLHQAKKYKVNILTGKSVSGLSKVANGYQVNVGNEYFEADKVVVTTGSSSSVWKWLEGMKLAIETPVPSLFTFNIQDSRLKDLQGISFDQVGIRIIGSKLASEGPLLITHWGLSGPAVLKLSSWGARELFDKDYQFEIMVNYLFGLTEQDVREQWQVYKLRHPVQLVIKHPLWGLPKRFWERIMVLSGICEKTTFQEVSKKAANKLIEELIQGRYMVSGKSTFKDEFVTAGGVSLSEVDLQTFECKRFPGLYLAGEVLDIDGLTGGFNFQACWSAGWSIATHI